MGSYGSTCRRRPTCPATVNWTWTKSRCASISAHARRWALKLRRVDYRPVLHRPLETTPFFGSWPPWKWVRLIPSMRRWRPASPRRAPMALTRYEQKHLAYLHILEKIFQAELDQPRRHRGLRNDAEVCRSQSSAGIAELWVVQRIVELHPESKLCAFPKAPDRGRLADREIRIELSRSVGNTLTSIPVTQRAVGPDCGRITDCRLIHPITQTRPGSAGGHQIFVCRGWAKCDRGGSGE